MPRIEDQLEIDRTISVGMLEVSGLGLRVNPTTGLRELLMIGDRSYELALGFPEPHILDLSALFPEGEARDSQWEAVAGDGAGRVFILQENPGTLFVISPDLESLCHTILLDVPPTSPLYPSWQRDKNSRGEGLVLLSNGHVLVLKEKNPSLLIEFGPPLEPPAGYQKGMALSESAAFPLPEGSIFVPLKWWSFSRDDEGLIGDLSDLCVGPDDRLYALSDQNRLLVRLESSLDVDEEKVSVKEAWRLPKQIDKPEGLVLTPDFAPIIARDTPKTHKNAFVLRPIRRA